MAGNNESIISLTFFSPNTLISDILYIPYKTPILEEPTQGKPYL